MAILVSVCSLGSNAVPSNFIKIQEFEGLRMLRHKLNRINRWLLRSSRIRSALGYIRFLWFVKVKKALRTVSSHGAFPVTINHNLKSIANFRSSRMSLLIDPLAVIETVDPQSRILVIG